MFETLTVTAVMEVSFEENVALRGFHVYCKEKWKSPNTVQKLSAEKEKNPFAVKIDPYSKAWTLKAKDKLIPVVVGLIPREISRFVPFLWTMVDAWKMLFCHRSSRRLENPGVVLHHS